MELLPLRVVALGGGHGLAASLSALRLVAQDLTAVVTVADDGGSSGRIRAQLPILPPGDLRMALAALAGSDGPEWSAAFQHRLGGDGDLAGHPIGNLLLAGLMDHLGDPIAALELAGRLIGAAGRVLPMSCEPLRLSATVKHADGETSTVLGQHEVAISPGIVQQVGLLPPDAHAAPEALEAIAAADAVVLGPGSWYSSVLPHVLLPQLREALCATAAKVVVTLNLVPQAGETDGFSPQQHLRVLHRYAPDLRVHTVLADARAVRDVEALEAAASDCGARLELASVADPTDAARHDPAALSMAYRSLLTSVSALAAVPGRMAAVRDDG